MTNPDSYMHEKTETMQHTACLVVIPVEVNKFAARWVGIGQNPFMDCLQLSILICGWTRHGSDGGFVLL